jgi:hypothetical protein
MLAHPRGCQALFSEGCSRGRADFMPLHQNRLPGVRPLFAGSVGLDPRGAANDALRREHFGLEDLVVICPQSVCHTC